MPKRKNMTYNGSKKLFRKTAGLNRIHPKNSWAGYNMRGGIRL